MSTEKVGQTDVTEMRVTARGAARNTAKNQTSVECRRISGNRPEASLNSIRSENSGLTVLPSIDDICRIVAAAETAS